MFDETISGRCDVFVCDHVPGTAFKETIDSGDSGVLKIEGDRIEIRQIEVLGGGKFKAIVNGFPQHGGMELHGLTIGQVVEFEGKHLFSCSSP